MKKIFEIIFFSLTFFIALPINCYPRFIFSMKWGEPGSGKGQFNSTYNIIQDKSGNIYVTDRENHRIQKFDSLGKYILDWGTFGSDIGQFNRPHGIAIDNFNFVYVADFENNRIQKFDSVGNFILKIDIISCDDLSVSDNGNIYAINFRDCIINIFNKEGNYIKSWGDVGTGNGQFDRPQAISSDKYGNVYVCDQMNNRIQKFDSNGKFILKFGSRGSGNGQFDTPYNVKIDSVGNIFVVDYGNNRIQKFDSLGKYISQFGTLGNNDGQFNGPTGMYIDNDGCIYVADYNNSRIQKFINDGKLFVTQSNMSLLPRMQIFPNPFHSLFNVKVTNPFENSSLKIYSILGEEIKSFKIIKSSSNEFSVSLNFIENPPGIYFIKYFYDNLIIIRPVILMK